MIHEYDSYDLPKRRVREPVQVYLDAADRDRLDRLTAQLDATKSEVLRRGLEALERRVTDPAEHPALRIIGILGEETRSVRKAGDRWEDPAAPAEAADNRGPPGK